MNTISINIMIPTSEVSKQTSQVMHFASAIVLPVYHKRTGIMVFMRFLWFGNFYYELPFKFQVICYWCHILKTSEDKDKQYVS